jgi:hypothetical protein
MAVIGAIDGVVDQNVGPASVRAGWKTLLGTAGMARSIPFYSTLPPPILELLTFASPPTCAHIRITGSQHRQLFQGWWRVRVQYAPHSVPGGYGWCGCWPCDCQQRPCIACDCQQRPCIEARTCMLRLGSVCNAAQHPIHRAGCTSRSSLDLLSPTTPSCLRLPYKSLYFHYSIQPMAWHALNHLIIITSRPSP